MVIKKDQIADISITSEESSVGHFTPVIGIEYGVSVDYDVKTQEIYWVETKNEDETMEHCTKLVWVVVRKPIFLLKLSPASWDRLIALLLTGLVATCT